jgi:hypothetical protein
MTIRDPACGRVWTLQSQLPSWREKLMIWICFSRSGIDSMIALEAKETFTCLFFVDKVLGGFNEELAERCPKKRARGTFLHFDNGPTHRADDDFNHFGIRRILHQPYSPDLAPRDFWLFGILKNELEGNTFANEIEAKSKIYKILMDIPLYEFISVFDEWMHLLRECIDSGSEYL